MTTPSEIVPLLVVRGAPRAINFYERALGARVLARYEHGAERRVSHADLALGDLRFSVTEEARAWNSDAPESLGGSPVVLQLLVNDAEAALRALQEAGASAVFPLQELLGERMARVRDPFGHLWLLRQRIEQLDTGEGQRQRDELFRRFAEQVETAGTCFPRTRSPRNTAPRNTAAVDAPLEGRDSLREAEPRSQEPNARLHLLLGPVGAGKSTFALALARQHGAVRLTLDEWMTTLFRPDRPETGLAEWYVERAARCVEQIWALAQALVASGTSAVLEIGLLQRAARESFYARVAAAGIALGVYVLDAPRELRRARVEERNRVGGPTFSMLVPPEIFELASDLWEPLAPDECQGRAVCFVDASTSIEPSARAAAWARR